MCEKKDYCFELAKQLHEQYAINNNSNLSSVVTLFVALIAVFGGYGYIFIHSSLNFNFEEMYNKCTESYTMDALVLAAMASFIVIAFMKHICLYQGYHQRFEQFITYSIRSNYHMIDDNFEYKIFPDDYSPFKDIVRLKQDLSHGQHGLAQGLFGEFLKFFFWMQISIIVSLLFKLGYNLYKGHCCSYPKSVDGIIVIICLSLVLIISYVLNCVYENKLKRRYVKLLNEYKDICPDKCYVDLDEISCVKGSVMDYKSNSCIYSIINIIVRFMNRIGRIFLFVLVLFVIK